MRNYNKYKKFIKTKKKINPFSLTILVLILMLTMAVGYSTFNGTLPIQGTAKIGTYSIEYNLNGGNELTNPLVTYDATMNAPLPTPTKMNCDFAGWYESSNFSGSPISTTPTRK